MASQLSNTILDVHTRAIKFLFVFFYICYTLLVYVQEKILFSIDNNPSFKFNLPEMTGHYWREAINYGRPLLRETNILEKHYLRNPILEGC